MGICSERGRAETVEAQVWYDGMLGFGFECNIYLYGRRLRRRLLIVYAECARTEFGPLESN